MQTFAIIWKPGPRWIGGTAVYDQPYIEAHADRLDQLRAEHRMVLSGPFPLRGRGSPRAVGLTVVKAVDEANLRAWLTEDPAIAHEVTTAEVYPFQIVIQALAEGELR